MDYARLIDHTLLKADATSPAIEKLCEEAKTYHFASVCVNPTWVEFAAALLQGSDVAVCTVIGFPLGASTLEAKAFEASDAVKKGATEVDMVINIGALKGKQNKQVEDEIRAVVESVKGKALVKVIIETCLLTEEEKVRACKLSVNAGADFVKTSTGFSTGGATAADVAIMRQTVGPNIGVKASGGIRDAKSVEAMVKAGATRIGASSGVAIVSGKKAASDY